MLLGIEWDVCFSVTVVQMFIAPATCNGGSHDAIMRSHNTYNDLLKA